jgi:hypothetical protein
MTDQTPNFSVANLEWSVRTANVLSHAKIESMEDFLSLNKLTVMSWRQAGTRTWKEIAEMQEYLRNPPPVWNPCAAHDLEIKRLREALAKSRDEIDEYIRQEYPSDHPVHERYRKRDFAANPARIALEENAP